MISFYILPPWISSALTYRTDEKYPFSETILRKKYQQSVSYLSPDHNVEDTLSLLLTINCPRCPIWGVQGKQTHKSFLFWAQISSRSLLKEGWVCTLYKNLPSGSGGVAYDFPMIVSSDLWWELFLHVEELPQSSHNFYSSNFVLFVKL